MPQPTIYFVGTPQEIAHHAAPLANRLNVEVVAADAVVNVAQPGDVAVFYSEHFVRFRKAVEQLKRQRVATLYMIDGILEWRNAWENKPDEVACPHTMRPVLSDKVACIGESQARILNGWNNHGKVEVVGVPRFDRYRADANGGPREIVPFPTHGACSATSGTKPFRILVMTAKTPAFTDDQWEVVKQSLADVKQAADRRGESVEIVWRLTRGLESLIGVKNDNRDLSGNELYQQLQTVDAVITTPSTSMIESVLAGKPTAVLDYHNCPTYVNPTWLISDAKHIDMTIDQLMDPPPAKLQYQNMVLNQTVYLESSATDRMVDLLAAMTREAAEQVAAGASTLKLSANMLPQPAATAEVLNHRELFPEDAAFVESDKEHLQALLSNARRYIDRLEQRVAVLESDLDAAHEVFEQIHAHPVAGPLVRLRERLLESIYGSERKIAPK